jgi:hypothetical protein
VAETPATTTESPASSPAETEVASFAESAALVDPAASGAGENMTTGVIGATEAPTEVSTADDEEVESDESDDGDDDSQVAARDPQDEGRDRAREEDEEDGRPRTSTSSSSASSRERDRDESEGASTTAMTRATTTTEAAASAATEGSAGETTMAAAAATTPAPAEPVDPADLPEQPSREQAQEAMEGIRGAMVECAAGLHGRAELDITVHPSGRVMRAVTGGTFAGTAEGSCMARAARRARFPRFSGAPFSLRYPYTL